LVRLAALLTVAALASRFCAVCLAGAHRRCPFAVRGAGASIAIVRGRWREFAGLAATLAASILVFVMLAGILIGVVMGLAAQGRQPGATWRSRAG